MRSDANKPLFIITPVGEFGPFTSDEILRQVSKGEILRTDRLRTSDGQLIGTVSDIESGRIRVVVSSGARSATGSDPAAKRSSSSPRITPLSGRHIRVAPGPSWAVGSVLAVVSMAIVGLVLWSGSSSKPISVVPGPTKPVGATAIPDTLPKIALTISERRPGSVDVLVGCDRHVESSLTVRVGLIGDTGGVRLEPADGRVVLSSGSASGKLTVFAQDDAQTPAKVRVLLATSEGYDAAGAGTLDLTVEPVPPVVVKPTIAWEAFAYDDQRALLLAEGSHGWAGKWGPSALEVVENPLPVPADFTGAPPPSRHAAAISHDNKASFSLRPLTQRIGSGTVWVSCLMQGQKRIDGETDWCALGFEDHGKGGFSIAPQCTKNRTQWHINAPQPDEKGQPRYQVSRTADISIPVRMVVRLELGASTADIAYWINPTPGHEPKVNAADQLRGLPALGFDRVSVYASKSAALHVADLRIGRTWQEVLPGR